MRLLKLNDKYTGWVGESCINSRARRWIKRWEHRHNRHLSRNNLRNIEL